LQQRLGAAREQLASDAAIRGRTMEERLDLVESFFAEVLFELVRGQLHRPRPALIADGQKAGSRHPDNTCRVSAVTPGHGLVAVSAPDQEALDDGIVSSDGIAEHVLPDEKAQADEGADLGPILRGLDPEVVGGQRSHEKERGECGEEEAHKGASSFVLRSWC
jgi:hypothetical protein